MSVRLKAGATLLILTVGLVVAGISFPTQDPELATDSGRQRRPAESVPPTVENRDPAADITVDDRSVHVGHGYAWVNFTLSDPEPVLENLAHLEVRWKRAGYNESMAPVQHWEHPGPTDFHARLEPLHWNATYAYRIVLDEDDGSRQVLMSGTFRTLSNPYQWAVEEDRLIYPGSSAREMGGCTMGFILRNPTNTTLYAVTAAHCWDDPEGKEVYLNEIPGKPFGEVVTWRYDSSYEEWEDWALIRIYAWARPHVSPAMEHWTGPTGLANSTDVAYNDVICHYGSAFLYGLTKPTEARCGRFEVAQVDADERTPATRIIYRGHGSSGDSGSPLIDYDSGRAIGIILGMFPATDAYGHHVGIALCSILGSLGAGGYDLALATAAYDPPPPRPTIPNVGQIYQSSPPHEDRCW